MPKSEIQLVNNPEEVVADDLSDDELEEQLKQLDLLGIAISEYRSEAIDYRAASGIERDWVEDREHYEGIDDVNRGELGSWESKPPGRGVLGGDRTGSTVFFNITGPFCDTASARVGDMLLPVDDKGWSINPTPIPDMVAVASGELPFRIEQQIRSQVPEENVESVIAEVVEKEKATVEEAKAQAQRASKRIEDWHIECQYNAEMRIVIEDASIVGTGVLKGPIPASKKHMAFKDGEMIIQDELQPVSLRVQVEKCYPDPSCGQNIQDGPRHFEFDDISDRALNALKKQPGYIEEQIERTLKEGPHQAVKVQENLDEGDQRGLVRREKGKLFQIWYVYCQLKKADIESSGLDVEGDEKDETYGEASEFTDIDIHLVMVNNRVILATLNHLDGGEFPYDYMVWRARAGMPYGIGVSRQIRIPQRVINGAGRNLMDNAGMAGGPMWIFNQGLVEPINEKYEIAPRKGWFVSEDADDVSDVRNAFTFVDMPMQQEDLQAIIRMGMNFAEYMSGLPSLLQGQQQEKEETLGGQQARRNDGSTTLRRIARLYDDKITTPHLRRYYKWILLYGEDNEKGDFVIEARGSSALIERDIQNQSIIDLAPLAQNPMYGLDPKKWMQEYLRSQKLDPKNFEYDDEEWRKLVEQMSAPPPDSSVQVAEIRANTVLQTDKNKTDVALGTMQNDNDQKERDRQLQAMIKAGEQQLEMVELQMKHAGDKDLGLDKIKADLTKTIMTLKTQVAMGGTAIAEPVVEPAGRAEPDRSFEQ